MHDLTQCLVLGANGFIGSHIIDGLVKKKHMRVKAFDRFSRNCQFQISPQIEIIKGDIGDEDQLRTALEGVNYVIHSYSATTPFISENDPYIDITENLAKSVRLLDICLETGVNKVVFISSAGAVYGHIAEDRIVSEEDCPLPISPYGIHKLSIEYYLEYFKCKGGLDYIVYRLSNPYGPRQGNKNNHGVIPIFIERIKNNQEIIVYGDGHSSRDYIYIEDAVSMMMNSFDKDTKYSLYNIASGSQTTLNDLIAELKTLLNKDIKITYTENPKTFLTSNHLSIERYCREFKKPYFVSIQKGLLDTINSQIRPNIDFSES